MQRRQVLAGIAGSSILTAGCTGDVDEQESTNPDQAAEKIETARDSLQEAAELVEEEAAKFDSVDESKLVVDVRTAQIDQQIDEAESELDAAEKVATSDQREVIEGLRDLARWMRSLSNVMAESGDVFDEFDIAMSYWDSDRFEDSAEQFQVVGNEVDEARETLTIAEERYQRVEENLDEDPGTYNPNDPRARNQRDAAFGYSDRHDRDRDARRAASSMKSFIAASTLVVTAISPRLSDILGYDVYCSLLKLWYTLFTFGKRVLPRQIRVQNSNPWPGPYCSQKDRSTSV